MTREEITPVILCGGSGTRLWPLSRKSFPKQFVPLIDNKSLLQLTLERVARLEGAGATRPEVICVAAEDHRFSVSEALQEAKVNGRIILEPVARNTAPAIALASLNARPESLILICPSDHHIPDTLAFVAMVKQGCQAAKDGAIVTFGVVPNFPSTAYGYIELGTAEAGGNFRVSRFIEKPAIDRAQALILRGKVLWNAGIFLARAGTMLAALHEHADGILQSCKTAMRLATHDHQFVRPDPEAFAGCRAESIDYAVLEHSANVVVVPFAGFWSDVGSWNAVADLTPQDEQGNRIDGMGVAIECQRTYIHAPYRKVAVLGMSDTLVVDTPDALLVAASSHAEQVKQVVEKLEMLNVPEAQVHRKVARPWGWYDSIDQGERFKVKRLVVKPGASLSLQKHHHRAEHWVVVSGTARVTKGREIFSLTENQSTYIAIDEIHRLENPGDIDLEVIEVQSGSYLNEDDIVRFTDNYGRA